MAGLSPSHPLVPRFIVVGLRLRLFLDLGVMHEYEIHDRQRVSRIRENHDHDRLGSFDQCSATEGGRAKPRGCHRQRLGGRRTWLTQTIRARLIVKCSIVGVDYDLEFERELDNEYSGIAIVVNARATCESDTFGDIVEDAMDEIKAEHNLKCRVVFTECFGFADEGRRNGGRASRYAG